MLIYLLLICGIALFALIIWGAFRVFNKRTVSNNFWRWCFRVIIILASIPVILLGLFIGLLFCLSYYPNKKFTEERWNEQPDKRYYLSKDLIKKQLLNGQSREEVLILLGNENQRARQNDSLNILLYDLGRVPAIKGSEQEYLLIELNADTVKTVSRTYNWFSIQEFDEKEMEIFISRQVM